MQIVNKHSNMFNILSHDANANENHSVIPLTCTRRAIIQKLKLTNGSNNVEKLEPLNVEREKVQWCGLCMQHFEISTPQKNAHVAQQIHF